MNATPAGSATPEFGRRWFQFRLRTLLLLIALVPAILYFLSTSGGRVYFSPDTLESTYQSERVLYGTDTSLFRSTLYVHRYKLVDYLVANGYWKPNDTDNPLWMLMSHWNRRWRDGHSSLHAELTKHRHWVQWTEEHSELAHLVWPLVLRVLRNNAASSYDAQGAANLILFHAKHSADIIEFKGNVRSDPEMRGLPDDWEQVGQGEGQSEGGL